MPDDATLFVIFHGSWSFLDTPNYIYVKTPEMLDHVYRAGHWLAEHQLPEGSFYRLTDGVGGDLSCCVSPINHPVIKNAGIASTTGHHGSHTTLLLAKPHKWHQLLHGTLDKAQMVIHDKSQIASQDPANPNGTHDPSTTPTKVSFFNVLEYSYNTCCPPSIKGLHWQAHAIPDYKGRGKAATLHFFAEHEEPANLLGHVSGAFRHGSLLLGADISITTDTLPVGDLCPPPLLDHRVFEFLELSSRNEALKRMGYGLATQTPEGHPSDDVLEDYWTLTEFRKKNNLLDLPLATCLPGAGSGGCP